MRRRKAFLLVAFICITRVQALNYVYDEFLFSKDTWSSWKLENPLDFNPTDLLPRAKEKYPNLDQVEYSSLDGPRQRIPPAKKSTGVGLSSDVEALDDEGMVEHAAKASQCMTCHVLATVVWSRLTNDILSGEDVTRELVRSHLEDACEKEAVEAMLKKYTILKMESGGGQSSLTFVVVRERRAGSHGAAATEAEEAAVKAACKNLVKQSGGELVTELLDQLSNFRRESVRLLVKYDRDGGNPPEEPPQPAPAAAAPAVSSGRASAGSGSGSSGRLPRLGGGAAGAAAADVEDDEYEDPDDLDEDGQARPGAAGKAAKKVVAALRAALGRGTRAPAGAGAATASAPPLRVIRGLKFKVLPGESECADLNPKCPDWAASGECRSNPAYMVGTSVHRGHCRKACGVCQPEDVLASNPTLAAEVEKLSAALLLAVKNLGCGASGACLTGVSGMAMSTGLLKQQLPKRELPPGMKEFPGGFILGKPTWGVPTIREVRSEAQRKASPPPASAAAAADDSAVGPGSSTAPSHAEVDRVLGPALFGKLLSIADNYFVYEYLYKNHTRHYHEERDGSLTEDWLLGRFTRESVSLISSATGEVAGLEELDLLPGGAHSEQLKAQTWPYVKQVYAGGDECVLAGGRRVVRRVEARLACSPDSGTYMLVREPDFCTYTFVVFVPELCALDYYRPRPKAQGAVLGAQQGARTGAGRQGPPELPREGLGEV